MNNFKIKQKFNFKAAQRLKSLAFLVKGSVKRFTGTIIRNNYQSGMIWFKKILSPLIGITRYNIRAYIKVMKFLHTLYKSGGLKYVVIYMKASSVLLQQSVGGQKVPSQNLGAAVAVTRSGLPRLIPKEMRVRIRARDRKVIKAWLTIFNLYRIIEIPGKLKLETITNPGKALDLGRVKEFCEIFFHHSLRTNKAFSAFFLSKDLIAKPFLIPKASGTNHYPLDIKELMRVKFNEWVAGPGSIFWNWSSTSPFSVVISSVLLRSDTVLFPMFEEWCRLTQNDRLLDFFEKVSSPWDKANEVFLNANLSLGKLGFKWEAAGKIRVFAMVDCWTQWLFRPLHDALFAILKEIPQDGTFDQHKPVHNLLKLMIRQNGHDLFSFDLSAATDRLPVSVQEVILGSLIGPRLAHLWKSLLVWRGYLARNEKLNLDTTVHYAVGQPMGALSSWAMLALTHHFVVQWAAFNARRDKSLPFSWFSIYAVLGDDIVIGDKDVASEYLKLMDWLGVDINQSKSLISHKRVCEFAKTYWIPDECTPLPFREFLIMEQNSSALVEYVRKYNLTIPDVFSSLGYGYKTKGSLYTKKLSRMGPRVRRILLALTSPTGPFARSLRDWLTMDSLSRSTDQNQWDRVAQRLVAVEFPIIIQRMKSLQASLAELAVADFGSFFSSKVPDSSIVKKSWEDTIGLKLVSFQKINVISKKVLTHTDPQFTLLKREKGNKKKGDSPRQLHLIDKPYRLSSEQMLKWGFIGEREEFLMELYQNLYKGSSRDLYGSISLLIRETEMIQDLCQSPSNYYKFVNPIIQEDMDVFAFVEWIWKEIERLENLLDDYPNPRNIIRPAKNDFFVDPSISNSKVWSRIRKLA